MSLAIRSVRLVWVLLLLAGCRGSATLSNRPIASSRPGDLNVAATASADPVELAFETFKKAEALLANEDPGSTAHFLSASVLALKAASDAVDGDEIPRDRAAALYHASVSELIEAAQQFGQIDGEDGIVLSTPEGIVKVPVRYHGFAWKPEDFNQWIPVGDYEHDKLSQIHQSEGWGVPMVVVRQRDYDEPFLIRKIPFAATVMIGKTPVTEFADTDNSISVAAPVLDVFNPLVFRSMVDEEGVQTPIARDISAPVAWLGSNTPHLNFEAFLHPDRMHSDGRLIMIEPYQRGKIPLILVHGLASDPLTWSGLINELRATDWFNDRYQVWVFGYSTGRPFLRSAAELRRKCQQAVATFTHDAPDPAMHEAVMIGHSMGGLVTKLQITDSDELLWGAFADRPLDSLQTDDPIREYLSELFFFRPSPFVKRAIFIGTPHRGSPIAQEFIGRLASKLVVRSHELSDEYATLLARNPGAIKPFFAEQIPTSVDMLKPQDPALQAMQELEVPQHIRLHSVIGNGRRMLVGGPADGTVPVDSARHADTDSELIVETTHRRLQSHPESVQEVLRILELHLQESGISPRVAVARD